MHTVATGTGRQIRGVLGALLFSTLICHGQSGGTAPGIASSPVKQTRPAGTNVTFSVSATGTPPLYYQWLFDSNSLAGATNAVVTLANVQTNNSGTYSAFVYNSYGFTNSANTALTVTAAPPFILTQPAAPTVWPQAGFSLSVSAIGSLPMSYQWQVNGAIIPGATNSVFVLSSPQFSDSGAYNVVITNVAGSKTSSNAVVAVSQVVPWGAGLTNANNYLDINDSGQGLIPAGLSNAVAIAGGGYHSLAVLPNGTVTAWGYDEYRETDVPSTLTSVMAVAAAFIIASPCRQTGR